MSIVLVCVIYMRGSSEMSLLQVFWSRHWEVRIISARWLEKRETIQQGKNTWMNEACGTTNTPLQTSLQTSLQTPADKEGPTYTTAMVRHIPKELFQRVQLGVCHLIYGSVCLFQKEEYISISWYFAQGKKCSRLHRKFGHIGMCQSHHGIISIHQTRNAMIELVIAPQS